MATPSLFNYDLTILSAAIVIFLLTCECPGRLEYIVYGAGYLLPILVYWCYHFFPVAPVISRAVFVTAYCHAIRPHRL